MRFWLIDVPALIITLWFRAYLVTLAAMAFLCWLTVFYSLAALAMDWPRIW